MYAEQTFKPFDIFVPGTAKKSFSKKHYKARGDVYMYA